MFFKINEIDELIIDFLDEKNIIKISLLNKHYYDILQQDNKIYYYCFCDYCEYSEINPLLLWSSKKNLHLIFKKNLSLNSLLSNY